MVTQLAPLRSWLIDPPSAEMSAVVDRLRRAPDVQDVVLLPDAHLATDVCVGTAFSTRELLYPQAVGGDIGCGMFAVAFDIPSNALADGRIAGRVLAALGDAIPVFRHHRAATIPMPPELLQTKLTDRGLNQFLKDEGTLQFGTLGSGNHFVELQADESNGLWLMIHSGSRAMGQAIRDHHLARAAAVGSGLRALEASTELGQAYLHDMNWASRYADANRRAMADRAGRILAEILQANSLTDSAISIDHNHVVREVHGEKSLWVHRKGAMPAGNNVAGVVPGSMGTESFHVTGRGVAESLCSSAHGAGRKLSREKARKSIAERSLTHQMEGVWFDYRRTKHLREEAPSAYKDVRAVMRAQQDLVRIDRRLRPVLSYKGS